MDLFINNYDFIPNPKRTGRVIKDIMKKYNLKQSELAERLYVEEKTIGNWLLGRSFPEIDTLVCIKNEFQISLNDLLLPDSKPVIEKLDLGAFYTYIDSKQYDAKETIETNRNDIIAFDYYIQKYFFSYLNSMDIFYLNGQGECHTYFKKPVLEVFKVVEDKIKNIYGDDYKIKLRNDSNIKNQISFEILKYVRLGKINVNVINWPVENHLVLNQFEDNYEFFIEYDELCYFGDFVYKHLKYQFELLSLLNPIEMDIVYSTMLLLKDNVFEEACNYLKDAGAKKLHFVDNVEVKKTIDNVGWQFGKIVIEILERIKNMNYDDYLNERSESNVERV